MKTSLSRKLFKQVIRFYPEPFRVEFSEEMLSVFDECQAGLGGRYLLLDALMSVARQQIHSLTAPKPAPTNLYREAAPTPKLALLFALSVFLAGVMVIPFAAHSRTDETGLEPSTHRTWYPHCGDHSVFTSERVALNMIESSRPKGAPK